MDYYAEIDKRKQARMSHIGELAYRRVKLTRVVESSQEEIAEIDACIEIDEAVVKEIDQSQRDFNTYLAVKEGATTLDGLKSVIEAGGVEGPPS